MCTGIVNSKIISDIENAVSGDNATVTLSLNSMSDMSTLLGGSGMSINIYGKDKEKLYEYGKQVGEPAMTSGKQELYETLVALYAK